MDIIKIFEQISTKANSPETERYFRETCSRYEYQCSAFNEPFSQEYQDYIDFYHRITSLYLTIKENNKTKLVIYDTESGKDEFKILDTSIPLGSQTSIAKLPNGELFCYGNNPESGITLIIDKNYQVRALPSGTPCYFSSCTYFNRNVYCFGGRTDERVLTLSRKFDLYENRWINLTPMPRDDPYCYSVVFNWNILISGFFYKHLLLYSPNIDSFSTIPYEFQRNKAKILINAERLYLIECFSKGFIYESEDEYAWKLIGKSIIGSWSSQACYLYNKGGIYIISTNLVRRWYFKFDLNQKVMDYI